MERFKSGQTFKTSLILLVVFVFLSGLLLALSTGGFVVNFAQVGFTIGSAAQKTVHSVSTWMLNSLTAIKNLSTLQEEYNILTEKLKNYEYMQRTNAQIRQENERLNELLDFSQNYSYKNIAAHIIGRDPNNLYSGISIDKGSRQGIKKNMPVIAIQRGNVGLVGKVVTVGALTSMVMPVYDFQCNVSARIQHTRDLGMVNGGGAADLPLMMNFIQKRILDELQYGDIIVTSGENGNYVREIPIGTISSISIVDYDSSLIISLVPIIDFSRLEEVIVVDTETKKDEQ